MPRETEEEMFKRLTSEARAEARREQYRDLERRRQRKIERILKERLPHEQEAEEEEEEEEEEAEDEDEDEEAVVRQEVHMVVQPTSIFQASRRKARRGKGIIMAKPRKRMMMCSAAAGAMTSVGGADVSVDEDADLDVVELDRVEANNNINGNWVCCSAEEEEEMGDVPPQVPTPPRRDDGTTMDSVAERCLVFAQDEEEEEEEEEEDREEEKGELATYVKESERRPLPGQVQGEVDQEPETSHGTDECATQSLGSLKAVGADRGTGWEEAWRQAITEEDEYMA